MPQLPLFADVSDFIGIPRMLTLSNSTPRACFTFDVVNDELYELREDFFVNLTTTDQTVTFRLSYIIVMILDDDGELSLALDMNFQSVCTIHDTYIQLISLALGHKCDYKKNCSRKYNLYPVSTP